jgi:hypothetical protein
MKANRNQTVTRTEQLKALLRKSFSLTQLASAPCRNRTCNLLVSDGISGTGIRFSPRRNYLGVAGKPTANPKSRIGNRNATVTEVSVDLRSAALPPRADLEVAVNVEYEVIREERYTNPRTRKGYLHLIAEIITRFPPKALVDSDVRHEDGCPTLASSNGRDCDCYPDMIMRQLERKP